MCSIKIVRYAGQFSLLFIKLGIFFLFGHLKAQGTPNPPLPKARPCLRHTPPFGPHFFLTWTGGGTKHIGLFNVYIFLPPKRHRPKKPLWWQTVRLFPSLPSRWFVWLTRRLYLQKQSAKSAETRKATAVARHQQRQWPPMAGFRGLSTVGAWPQRRSSMTAAGSSGVGDNGGTDVNNGRYASHPEIKRTPLFI